MRTKILLSALAVVLSVGLVTAQEQDKTEKTTTTQNGPAFVDKDNNGICDNFENGTPGNPNADGKGRLLDGSGRGRGQGYGMHNGRGRGGRSFVDADENGICDYYESGRAGRRGRGPGNSAGLRNGKGRAVNFVDANDNGICDRRETVKQ
jgi:hypothetical protein